MPPSHTHTHTLSLSLSLSHSLHHSLSHTLAFISPHLLLVSILRPPQLLLTPASAFLMVWFFSFISIPSFSLSVSKYHESNIWPAGASFFCNILLKFLCFTLHIPTPQMGTLYFSKFSCFLFKPTEIDRNFNKTETDWFPSISFCFSWEFHNPKFSVSVGQTQKKPTEPNRLHPYCVVLGKVHDDR